MSDNVAILIVEGNGDMATLLQRFLARQQVVVHAVTSVAEARTSLAQRTFCLVVTDLFLPHGDGLALLHHVRRVAPHTRVVIMAAFGAPELHQRVLAEGACAFMAKPFRLQHLWDVIQQALRDTDTPREQPVGDKLSASTDNVFRYPGRT